LEKYEEEQAHLPKVGIKLRTDSKFELISHGVTSIAMHKILNHARHFNTYTETLIFEYIMQSH